MNPYSLADATALKPRRRLHIWIPLLLVWVLLLPFILLLAPLVFVACLIAKVDPFQGVLVYWQIFNALRGLRVEVDDPGVRIRIH
jgi:hypothetical protein